MIETVHYNKFKDQLPQVDGKVFVITGTTSGTGFVAAQCAAEKGGEVILLNRMSPRVDDMMTKLQKSVPNGKFVNIECNLQDFTSVRNAISEIKNKYQRIYCLCNNAGTMGNKDDRTVDGYDIQMQTNHLSHFLLTAQLFPLLEAEANNNANNGGDAPRIVNHSSDGRHLTRDNGLQEKYFDNVSPGCLGGDEIPLIGHPAWLGLFGGPRMERYFQSKLANSIFTHGLHNKLQKKNSAAGNKSNNIRAIAAHPGGAATNISNYEAFRKWALTVIRYVLGPFVQSAEDGAMGIIRGMMDPTVESGCLYGPTGYINVMSGLALRNPPKRYETDNKAIEMLWRKSEEATKVKFDI